MPEEKPRTGPWPGRSSAIGTTTASAFTCSPGQLRDGLNAGRWNDAHNARPSYHYIMLRGLAELAAVMPKDHAARPELIVSLSLGLKNRNNDVLKRGAANKDKAIEVLVFVNRAFASEPGILGDSQSPQALDALAKLISAQYRRGHAPVGPRECGQFLEYVAWREGQLETSKPNTPASLPYNAKSAMAQ
jgi:hypothetical protein